MTRVPDTHFAARYDRAGDPWELSTRWYEQRKRALTLASLPRRRYRSAFEPGCAIGLLTHELAARCDEVWAVDVAPAAVAAARQRCAQDDGVRIEVGAVPGAWPSAAVDLVVLSEVGYYLSTPALEAVLDQCDEHVEPAGHVVAAHFRPSADEHLRDGDDVHAQLRSRPGWSLMASYTEDAFLLDVFAISGSAPGVVRARTPHQRG